MVAVAHGRRGIGIDLNERYILNHAVKRVESELFATSGKEWLVPRPPAKAVTVGRRVT